LLDGGSTSSVIFALRIKIRQAKIKLRAGRKMALIEQDGASGVGGRAPQFSFGATLEESAIYRKVILRTVPFLLLCYVVNVIDRVNISFAKLEFQSDLHLSDASYGFGAGAFYIGYLLFEVPSNLLLQRLGARFTMARIMCLWGMVSFSTAFVTSANQFYLVRILLGVAEAGFFPGVVLYLTYWFPNHLRGRVMSYFVLGIGLSGIVGGPLSGFIMHHIAGASGLKGWQWLFVIEGVLPVLCGLATYFVLTDRPRDAHWLSEDQKRIVIDNLAADAVEGESRSFKAFLSALRNPKLWLATMGFVSVTSGAMVLNFWAPSIIQHSGVSDVLTVGLLSAFPPAIGAIGMLLICRSSDRMLERRWHFATASWIGTIAVLLLTVSSANTLAAIVCLGLLSVGWYSTTSLLWTIPPRFLSEAESAGGIAFISAIGGLGALITPPIFGYLIQKTGSIAAGSFYIAAVLMCGSLAVLSIKLAPVEKR
jgi:ACS family phthalate transporter-like MFS transporter